MLISFPVKTCDGKDYRLFFTAGHWRVCYGNTGQPFHAQRIYASLIDAISSPIWPKPVRHCWIDALERAGLSPKTEARA